jgi:hypothetical protein
MMQGPKLCFQHNRSAFWMDLYKQSIVQTADAFKKTFLKFGNTTLTIFPRIAELPTQPKNTWPTDFPS